MEVKKVLTYTIVTLWIIASLLDLKDNLETKNILMLVVAMASFVEAFI